MPAIDPLGFNKFLFDLEVSNTMKDVYLTLSKEANQKKKVNMSLIKEKNAKIELLRQQLHEYQGSLTQRDVILIINRVAKENKLPRFLPTTPNVTKTQFMNYLTNYLYNATAKEEADQFVG